MLELTFDEKIKRASKTESIADNILHLKTLEVSGSDALDFHSLAVWCIQEALEQAYKAGWESAYCTYKSETKS